MSHTWIGASAVKLALGVKRLRDESADATLPFSDPIAVVGIGCRFPGGADSPDRYWQLLLDGVDTVREVPADRWDANALYDPDPQAPGRMNSRWGSFLDGIDQFDPVFFGIAPREATTMDPQQRLLLEVAWESLWDAGIAPHTLAGSRTGVFTTNYIADYARMLLADAQNIGPNTCSGGSPAISSGRISYLLDLRGPSVTIDTACSSSLSIIHMACQSLRAGDCSLALAGGATLHLTPEHFLSLAKLGMMSPDGKCHTFDAAANGFAPGEGCGVVALKRLRDAIADGDRIHAVVRGTAVMQDGRSTVLTAPNGPAQEDVVRAALANAHVSPEQITYVETHGTGTALGDPIEVEALTAALPGTEPCVLGAVKTNLGHLEAAAGIAGFIKAVLALAHEQIPPNLHFNALNPHIMLEGTRFVLPTQARPWPRTANGRFAGVSAFGFGGTNAHVILEEAPKLPAQASAATGTIVLPFSARDPEALTVLARRYQDVLRSGVTLGDVCRAAAIRRSHYEERAAVVGATAEDAISGLQEIVHGRTRAGVSRGRADAHGMVFVCSGQGSQWPRMGRDLMQHDAFRKSIEACDAAITHHASWSLIEQLDADEASSRLNHTEYAQPAIVAMEIALARLWESWGIVPEAIIGHSVGEIAAAHLAGAMTLDEAMRIVLIRGRIMERATGIGRMAAVYLEPDALRREIATYGDRVSLAAVNGPASTVVSGDPAIIDTLLADWKHRGIEARPLPVDYAFHSQQMDPFRIELVRELGEIALERTTIPMISTVTGETVTGVDLDRDYWGRNMRQPVLFANAVQQALALSLDTFVEVGPHPVLASAVQETISAQHDAQNSDATFVASLRKNQDAHTTMFASLGSLYARGASVQWNAVYPKPTPIISLPAYPYQRDRYWAQRSASYATTGATHASIDSQQPFIGSRVRSPLVTGVAYEVILSPERFPYLADHVIGGSAILPMTGFLEIVIEAVNTAFASDGVTLRDIVVQTPLVLPRTDVRTVHVLLDNTQFRVFSLQGEDWTLHAQGQFSTDRDAAVSSVPEIRERVSQDASEHYANAAARGAHFGPAFQTVVELSASNRIADARVRLTPSQHAEASHYYIHPALLDGCLQTVLAAADDTGPVWVPIAIDRVTVHGRAGAEVRSTLRVHDTPANAETLAADVWVRDVSGNLVATITGLRFKRARADAIDPTAALRYRLAWSARARNSNGRQASTGGTWLILGDSHGVATTLQRALERRGESCVIRPIDVDASALNDAAYQHVVYLGAADPARDTISNLRHPLELIQVLVRRAGDPPRVWIVTHNAESIGEPDAAQGFQHASLLGFARTVSQEHPELACKTVDLDSLTDIEPLVAELLQPDDEDRMAFRATQRYVPRLESQRSTGAAPGTPRRLTIPARGTLDNIAFDIITPAAPGVGEVEVHVDAAALNFRDVLNVLGMYPGDPGPLGLEFAGRIARVGHGVTQWHPGDRVMGMSWGTFASSINVSTTLLTAIPAAIDTESAATLPNAFVTAHHCLINVARLRAGDRVLIHAGAGGVGMAAIQLALDVGAEVYTTAGNDEKRAYLRSMGVHHVMDSRSLEFSREILHSTNGRGVDVVLNSLSGDFIGASFAALGQNGRFVEIGKIGIWTDAQVDALGKNITYSVVDLGQVMNDEPEVVGKQLDRIRELAETGHIRPLPYSAFDFDDAPAAFRHMAQAKHLGRIVLRFPAMTSVRPNATYVVTGGLGGIGHHIARWLVDRGATHVVLLGRSAPSDAATNALRELRETGATIEVRAVNVANRDDLDAMFAEIRHAMPPIHGIVHAAGVIDDGALLQQRWDRFAPVLAPKVDGAWNLHELTRNDPLDFFVLCSSVASVFGSAGQSAYSAGNAYLDALAAHRRAHGHPALSINWGAWADVGMAARTERDGRRIALEAIRPFSPALGIACFERALHTHDAQVIIADARWNAWHGYVPSVLTNLVHSTSRETTQSAQSATSDLHAQLAQAPNTTRRTILLNFVKQEARRVLGLSDTHAIDERQPLLKIGLDSLMAVELRNRIAAALGRTLPATLLFDHPSPAAITEFVLGASTPQLNTTAEPDDAVLQDIAAMSDEEAERLLARELGTL